MIGDFSLSLPTPTSIVARAYASVSVDRFLKGHKHVQVAE